VYSCCVEATGFLSVPNSDVVQSGGILGQCVGAALRSMRDICQSHGLSWAFCPPNSLLTMLRIETAGGHV
jgi:hypothetical protein